MRTKDYVELKILLGTLDEMDLEQVEKLCFGLRKQISAEYNLELSCQRAKNDKN